jgi:hypothetical protein
VRLIKRREQGLVEQFITQAHIEALDEPILHGLARGVPYRRPSDRTVGRLKAWAQKNIRMRTTIEQRIQNGDFALKGPMQLRVVWVIRVVEPFEMNFVRLEGICPDVVLPCRRGDISVSAMPVAHVDKFQHPVLVMVASVVEHNLCGDAKVLADGVDQARIELG